MTDCSLLPSMDPFGDVQLTFIPEPGVEEVPVPANCKDLGTQRNTASTPALAMGWPAATSTVIVSLLTRFTLLKSITVSKILPGGTFFMTAVEPRLLPVVREIQL